MFSVLMPICYKERPEFFSAAFDSIINQTLVPNEIVLIKDGPLTKELDNQIVEYEKKYPEILKVIDLPENQGLGIALGIGVEACKYELIARMDADDIARNDRFEIQIKFLNEHPEIDILSSNIAEFENSIDHITGYRILPQTPEELFRFGKKRSPVNHMTVVFRKSSVLKAGNYQHLRGIEDYYLWMRMMSKGMKFYNLQEPLVYARVGKMFIDRRHGWKYYKAEKECFKKGYEIGFLNYSQYISSIFVRGMLRLFPSGLTRFVYAHILRISKF